MELPIELKELGLEDNEIKVYLVCLSDNGLNVKQIAERTQLIRTTIYGLLKSLMNKGLISNIDKEGVMSFHAVSPKELINILDEKKAKIESIIPQLEQYAKFMPSTLKIESFEGINGVHTITNDIISKSDAIVKVIGAGQKWLEFSNIFTSIYYRRKKEMNVHTKTILADIKEEKLFLKSKKSINSEIRFLKGVNFGNTTIYIYHDKVSFVVYDKDKARGFIIRDAEFNRIQNLIFDGMWEKAKPLSK